ncbi:hypothetical protein [Mycobacterium sp. E2497]|uniref:hypothetical protein n=1 Tax=Mycobacterium sp. E2497 TaxID=1834135 RepID=UPI0007FBA9AA|nr:hypothetical protein [Mycobacterium sp. E2497]OBI24100.1 hypothetical protein A5713_08190 [Mycobacterium sp. E2497]
MRYAVASVARSMVVAKKQTGYGVHYARAKDFYRVPKRYREGDAFYTWHYVTGAMDILRGATLIEQEVGRWSGTLRTWRGLQSVSWATATLMGLIGPLVDPSEPRGVPRRVETVVLRDRADKADIDYVETAETTTMRDQLRVINEEVALLELHHQGDRLGVPPLRRIFNGSFDRGGRLYCHGASYQNMSSGQRLEITVAIDDTTRPMVEIDYSNMHISMAYCEAGTALPPDDQYAIRGFSRGLVKMAVNTLFNAATVRKATLAITEALRKDPELRAASGLTSSDRAPCLKLAEGVVAAIETKHSGIKEHFGSDCGAAFQRRDSDMAIKVLTRMLDSTGRCPLPVHDSFLVADTDADILGRTMTDVASEHGLQLRLKDSRRP